MARLLSYAQARTTRIFWVVACAFLVFGVGIGSVNRYNGGWDSSDNLVVARNVAEGRGFVTDVIQDFITPQTLPNPETIRPPGAVFLLAGLFRMFGASLAIQVIANFTLIFLSAVMLRAATREVAPGWAADLAGLLLLLTPGNYTLMSWLNNNLLVLLVTTALYFGMRSHVRRYNGWAVSLGCGGLTAVAFLTKQTYVLSFAAFATVVIMGSRRTPLPTRFLQLVTAGALTLLLTSVYWAPNLAKYGTPIYSPIQGLRLPTRYLGREIYDELRTVSFGKTPYTYRRVVAEIGMREFVRREIARDVTIVVEVVRRGVIPLFVAFAGLILVRRRHWFPYALALTMAIAPIFDSMYWIAEPRYLYPLYPIMLFASGLAIARYRACERWGLRAPLVHRLRVVFGLLLLATVVRTAVEVPLAAHQAIFQARTPPPAWAATVSALPADAVLLTSASPTHVAWWSRHRVVVEPILSHDDLVAVMAMYKPQYYFDDRPNDSDHARFEPGELTPIASGDGWRLYRIEPATQARAERG